jgi:HK97 family phage major capsid protein
MVVDELINSIEVELEQTVKQRDKSVAEVKYILETARKDGRGSLSKEEDERVAQLFETRDRLKNEVKGIESKLEAARRARAEELETQKYAEEKRQTGTKAPSYDQVARVGAEERTYTKEKDRKGAGFLRDVSRQYFYRDLESEHRLARHMQEERVERGQYLERAVGTSAWTGLTVPQYLTDMYAPAVAANRPFADICSKHDLPESGMTVNISRVTTPSSVANQTTQNTAVSEQNMADSLLTINVQTASGQQTLSRQAIDRGTGIEEVTVSDLFKRFATNLDSNLLNQATTGLSASAGTAATVTTQSLTGVYPQILAAAAASEAALLAQATPNYAVMHSRRWYWLSNLMTNTWPAINQPRLNSYNIGSNDQTAYSAGVRGVLPNGMLAVVDNNITTAAGTGTNQDEIYVVASEECHLWEDPGAPVFIRAEQPAAASLGVLLVLYGYYAYTFGRYPNGQQKLAGAGLVTPTFTGS